MPSHVGVPVLGCCVLLSGVRALPAAPPELDSSSPADRGPTFTHSTREDGRFEQGRNARLEGIRVEEAARGEGDQRNL